MEITPMELELELVAKAGDALGEFLATLVDKAATLEGVPRDAVVATLEGDVPRDVAARLEGEGAPRDAVRFVENVERFYVLRRRVQSCIADRKAEAVDLVSRTAQVAPEHLAALLWILSRSPAHRLALDAPPSVEDKADFFARVPEAREVFGDDGQADDVEGES